MFVLYEVYSFIAAHQSKRECNIAFSYDVNSFIFKNSFIYLLY